MNSLIDLLLSLVAIPSHEHFYLISNVEEREQPSPLHHIADSSPLLPRRVHAGGIVCAALQDYHRSIIFETIQVLLLQSIGQVNS